MSFIHRYHSVPSYSYATEAPVTPPLTSKTKSIKKINCLNVFYSTDIRHRVTSLRHRTRPQRTASRVISIMLQPIVTPLNHQSLHKKQKFRRQTNRQRERQKKRGRKLHPLKIRNLDFFKLSQI